MLSLKTLFCFLLVGQVSSYSEWECRPLDAGACGAPHTEKSDCDGTPSCCSGSIITDWRTGKMSCRHDAIPGVDYTLGNNNITKSSETEIDIETLDLGEIESSSFGIVNPTLVATAVAAATVIVGLL